MNTKLSKWREEEGGIDFVQLVIGLLIISIAAVGTFQSLFWGYEQLDFQMRYRKAISIARSYAEYWQGRIHTDFPEPTAPSFRAIKAGNLAHPLEVLLDERDPLKSDDDIMCKISYAPLNAVDLITTGEGIDYWTIRVRVTWFEPTDNPRDSDIYEDRNGKPHEIEFYTAMNPATL